MSKTTKDIGSVNVPEGCYLEDHERATTKLLKAAGKHITFVIPKRQPGSRTPDIMMDGKYWEIKYFKGKSRRTIVKKISEASKQSLNIIFDISESKLSENIVIAELEYQFRIRRNIKHILIVSKNNDFRVLSREK